jgi:hypothetical protein
MNAEVKKGMNTRRKECVQYFLCAIMLLCSCAIVHAQSYAVVQLCKNE